VIALFQSAPDREVGRCIRDTEIAVVPFLTALAGCSARRAERHVAGHTSEVQRRNAPVSAAIKGTSAVSASLKVKEQKLLLDTVLDNLEAHVYMKDQDRRYLYVNPCVAAVFGRRPEEIIGKIDTDLMAQAMADHFAPLDRQVLDTGKKSCGEEAFTDSKGELRHFWSTKLPILKDGQAQHGSK